MGKQKGAKIFPGKEAYQRMNFLYQAASVILAQPNLHGDLPAYYGQSLLSVAQKSVSKITPEIKRDLCKGCGNVLRAGVTLRVRVRSGAIIYTCSRCGTIKRFPSKTGYKLWIENDAACLEVIEIPTNADLVPSILSEKDLSKEKSKTAASCHTDEIQNTNPTVLHSSV